MIVLILCVCEPAPAQAGGVNLPLASFASASSRVAAPGCDLLGSASQNFVQSNLKKQRAEYALGSRLAADVDEHNELVADNFIRQYVNHLEQKITGSSKLPGCFLVKVISNPEPNAYSLPGGFIYVTTGLIGAIDSEGELVATLAHETGHVTARHQTRIDAKTYIWGRLALVGGPAGYALRRYLGPLLIFKLFATQNSRLTGSVCDTRLPRVMIRSSFADFCRLFFRIGRKKNPFWIGCTRRTRQLTRGYGVCKCSLRSSWHRNPVTSWMETSSLK